MAGSDNIEVSKSITETNSGEAANATCARRVKATDRPRSSDAAIVVRSRLGYEATQVQRILTGLCHHVFSVTAADEQKFVVRIGTPATKRLLEGGIYWNQVLRAIGVPLPKMLAADLEPLEIRFPFVILERMPGTDLGLIYQTLSSPEKLGIVSELVRIQKEVSELPEASGFGYAYSYSEPPEHQSWAAVVLAILGRARQRISRSDHPGLSYVERATRILGRHESYFAVIRPAAFLDDTTTKNVLVDQGRLSGVVDVDQLCFGDPLLTIGLTQTALLGEAFSVDYVEHWMNLLELGTQQRKIVQAYTLLFCVDFMSELGQRFNRDETPEFNAARFARLESVFEDLTE
jgi:aminoglycoside phosphotransferase (APT) family kinase protein